MKHFCFSHQHKIHHIVLGGEEKRVSIINPTGAQLSQRFNSLTLDYLEPFQQFSSYATAASGVLHLFDCQWEEEGMEGKG